MQCGIRRNDSIGRLLVEEGITIGIGQGREELQRRFQLKEEEVKAYFEKYALVAQ